MATTAFGIDLDGVLDQLVQSLSPDAAHRSPDPAERDAACAGLARLADGDLSGAADVLLPLGFSVSADVDRVTGRRFALAASEPDGDRTWGYYVVDLTSPAPRLSVAVPHPRFDRLCEQLALRLWRRLPGSMLAVAAVHRDALDAASDPPREADQARNTSSLFHHLWSDVLGPRGVPQVQIHGFADTTAPEEVAVSTGAAALTPAAVRIADGIEATGRRTTRSWDGTASDRLLALTNTQGRVAKTEGWVWVHVEHNRTVRETPSMWEPAIDAIAAADPALPSTADPATAPAATPAVDPATAPAATPAVDQATPRPSR